MSWKLVVPLVTALLTASCGGGGDAVSGGGSGIGGTGISFVKGNVVSVNGQTAAGQAKALFSSATIFESVTVTGGGKSTPLNQFGGFELANVELSENLVLTFTVTDSGTAKLPVGQVASGQTITLRDIAINTGSGKASPVVITRTETDFDDLDDDNNSMDDDRSDVDDPDDEDAPDGGEADEEDEEDEEEDEEDEGKSPS